MRVLGKDNKSLNGKLNNDIAKIAEASTNTRPCSAKFVVAVIILHHVL